MLNKMSPVALYYQIAEELSAEIRGGAIAVGDKLPSEQELVNRYNVSRTTVRLALDKMLHDGLIERKQGLGTFACHAKVTQNLGSISSWAETVAGIGRQPHSFILSASEIGASESVGALMELPVGSPLYYIKRLRCIDGREVCVSENFVRTDVAPGLLQNLSVSESLYFVLENIYGLTIHSAVETIEAGMSTLDESNLLKLKRETPILRITRVTRNAQDRVIEIVKSTIRSSAYAYSVKLLGRPSQTV